ncbi:hypothetical protein ABE426_09055 [Sphingobacterium faecium]|uniref:hypothetical protein n=1 Tax=Sphingobacterium faecium TaxID=34087 RepID=UPI00320912F9
MKTTTIKLNKGTYLSVPVPTNTIFCKNLTGIGATHIELNIAQRNSIIVEPNVPVIIDKTKGRKDVLGIFEGVTKVQIKKYLRSSTEYKKLVTTPESLPKIIAVFEEMEVDYLNTYFMFIDECDKLTKDVNYRKSILLSLEYFFKFKYKAFVSATALIPSDPRFKENGFSLRSVIPTFDIKRDLNVITTNHSLSTLNKVLKSSKADKVFIFLNSISGIASIIKSLKIDKLSSVFTSKDGRKEFYEKTNGVNPNHVLDIVDNPKFSKFNFLTSRYFSAVDIKLNESVDIVMISDIDSFQHSMIDPSTDVLQIIGRLRNKKLVNSITFICKIPKRINYVSELSMEEAFTFGTKLRDFLKTAYISTQNYEIKSFIEQFIEINGDRAFFNDDFTPNNFMMDNFRLENKVKSMYSSTEKLINAIKGASIRETDIKYFNVEHIEESYDLFSLDIKLISARKPFKDRYEELITIMETIQKLKKKRGESDYKIDNLEESESMIIRYYKEMYEIYLNEGVEKLRKIGKKQKAIKDYFALYYENTHLKNVPLISELYKKFEVGKEYNQSELLDAFMAIYQKYDPEGKRETKTIERLYNIRSFKKRVDSIEVRMIELEKAKFEISK